MTPVKLVLSWICAALAMLCIALVGSVAWLAAGLQRLFGGFWGRSTGLGSPPQARYCLSQRTQLVT